MRTQERVLGRQRRGRARDAAIESSGEARSVPGWTVGLGLPEALEDGFGLEGSVTDSAGAEARSFLEWIALDRAEELLNLLLDGTNIHIVFLAYHSRYISDSWAAFS